MLVNRNKRKDGSMERTGWQQTWVRIMTTVLTVAMMVLIFCFSTEDAAHSDRTSGKISSEVVHVVHPDYDQKPPQIQKVYFDDAQHIVRKTAHFTEYLLLGLLIRLCLESWFGSRKGMLPVAWGAGTIYAGTDELHQLMIDGRSGQLTDVMIDSCGVLTGALIANLILHRLLSKKRRQT